jgi:oxalate decarboxylase
MSDPWQHVTGFSFDLAGSKPAVDLPGGTIREANQGAFPVLNGLAVYLLTLEPGAVRIPHWHPVSNEVQYILSGKCQVGLIGTANGSKPGTDHTYRLTAGEIGFIPAGWFHYILNDGPEPATMLIIFNSATPDNVDISWGFRITRPELLKQVFGIGFNGIDTDQIWISPAAGAPGSPVHDGGG